jgi:hypothetical protein
MPDITLEWDAPTDGGSPVQYNIYRINGSQTNEDSIKSGGSQIATINHDANAAKQTHTDADLTFGATFSYTVGAQNAAGEGDLSEAATATA